MLLVAGFLMVFLALLGLAYSQLAAALRVQTVCALQAQRDQGSIPALARGLALLETGSPPSEPYICAVTINTPTGPCSYTVTFASTGPNNWSVSSAPTVPSDNPVPMPNTFAP
jgi:hypothetical protein